MRIDWFSPLPPARTAIADYTGRLLAALGARAEVTLWTDQAHWNSGLESHAAVRRFDPRHMRWDELHAADAVFYNLGNNAQFHQPIWQVARQCPGFAIMHDVLVHDSVAWDHQQRHDRATYLELMQSLYGARGRRDGELYWSGVLTRLQMGRLYSCAPFLLESSLGAIVHSGAAEQALLKEVDVPVVRLPLPFPARPPGPGGAPYSAAALGGPPWKLVVFGFLGANRCLEQILTALARLEDRRFQLHIYGNLEERAEVEAAIERLRLADTVTLHGFVPDAELDAALAAAQLVLNLRYPTKGEASYSQLRIWSHGLPSLVTRVGWYAEQPAGTVAYVRPHFLVEDLCAHLRAYAAKPASYLASGIRGYEHLLEHHSPRSYAAQIVELAGQAQAYRKRWNAMRMSDRAAEGLQGWFPAAGLEGYANRVGAAVSELTAGHVTRARGKTARAANLPAAPVCPEHVNVDELFQSVPAWHQRWEIFQDVFTPGRNSVEALMSRAGVPAVLSGKRVLDIGAFNCCCSFECERRGAGEVVALDLQNPAELGFPVLRDAVQSSRVRFVQGSAYNLDPGVLGKFDVVLFFGVLYHLRYPLLAIDQLRRIARGKVYIESLVIDHRFLEGGRDSQELAAYHQALPQVPLWQFYKGNELAGDYSNWFGPNIRAVLDAFESAGLPAELIGAWDDRATFQATAGGHGHVDQSYEGMSELIRQQLGLER